jgi:hypothetical protein
MYRKLGLAGLATLTLLVTQALPAAACGGLIAPNGAIRLSRATTLVDWHDGVERYMTSFTYQGEAANFGWVVPLPAVPDKIEEGGGWTLQRLFRETHPLPRLAFSAGRDAAQASYGPVEILQQTKVRALDITVLRGSGEAVLDWAGENGFLISNETRAHLLVYAHGSPIFMAAKYDAAAAKQSRQNSGDGAPVLITMKTAHPWVPLEVLSLGTHQVKADLYLLTDDPVNTSELGAIIGEPAVGSTVPGAVGFKINYQQQLNSALYRDLSTDKNMGWVRPDSWLTYLSLDAPGHTVTYDMGITSMGVIKLARYGTNPMAVVDAPGLSHATPNVPKLPMGSGRTALVLLALTVIVGATLWVDRRKSVS